MESEAPSFGNVGSSDEVPAEILPGEANSNISHMSMNTKPNVGKFDVGEETPEEYDKLRFVFTIMLAMAGLFGSLALFLLIDYHIELEVLKINVGVYTWKSSPNLHEVIMLTFAVILQGTATLIYRIFPFTFNRNIVKYIHFGLHALVGIAMIVGLLSVYSAKEDYAQMDPNKTRTPNHFFTQHGWGGIVSIPCFLAQLVGGAVFFLLPLWPIGVRVALMPFHKAFGWFIYLGSCTTALMAFNNGFFAGSDRPYLQKHELLARFSFLFLFLHVITALYLALAPQFKRRPRPE